MHEHRHEKFMREAIGLAEKGRGRVSPNPLVGALVVKKGRVVSRGAHMRFGGPHAEIEALARAGPKARGADLYVTLEPCSTWGKTGPCTEVVIQSGVRNVMIGSPDPNPRHRGRGVEILRRAGINVRVGILSDHVREQNSGFFSLMERKRPYVILKMAQSLDGKINTASGVSQWITSAAARRWVHGLRSRVDAVMAGTNTIRLDNPRLTVRFGGRKYQPARIVLDRRLRLASSLNVFRDNGARVILVTSAARRVSKRKRNFGDYVTVLDIREKRNHLDLKQLFFELGKIGITSVLVEGGGELAASLLHLGLVDKVYLCIAPVFLGGREAKTSVEGDGAVRPQQGIRLEKWKWFMLGSDIVLEGTV